MGPGNRPLDLDWLEDFLALAENGNFSRAALARNIAQPAFSRHIKSLEDWVGVSLFDRTTHPVTLTAAGKRLKPDVSELLLRLEASRLAARAAHDQSAASLQFAATHALSLTFFPTWLSGIEAILPVGRRMGPIQMTSDSFSACEDVMLQGRAQFLLCHGHADVTNRLEDAQFEFVKIAEDHLIPVSSASKSRAPTHLLSDKKNPPVLMYGEASGIGRIMRAVLHTEFEKNYFTEVFSAQHAVLLKTMAMEGRGIAWLPQSLIATELKSRSLVPAGDAKWTIPIDVRLVRSRAELTETAEALWQLVSERKLESQKTPSSAK
jgi:LysR family transcriptional regulator, hypochlorite-specific transcription factor HypT